EMAVRNAPDTEFEGGIVWRIRDRIDAWLLLFVTDTGVLARYELDGFVGSKAQTQQRRMGAFGALAERVDFVRHRIGHRFFTVIRESRDGVVPCLGVGHVAGRVVERELLDERLAVPVEHRLA